MDEQSSDPQVSVVQQTTARGAAWNRVARDHPRWHRSACLLELAGEPSDSPHARSRGHENREVRLPAAQALDFAAAGAGGQMNGDARIAVVEGFEDSREQFEPRARDRRQSKQPLATLRRLTSWAAPKGLGEQRREARTSATVLS